MVAKRGGLEDIKDLWLDNLMDDLSKLLGNIMVIGSIRGMVHKNIGVLECSHKGKQIINAILTTNKAMDSRFES